MQVFKAFIKILLKRIPAAMIWIVIFIVIGAINVNNSSEEKTFKDTKLDVCVFDEDATPASKSLTEFIGKEHKLVSLNNDMDEILDALYYERVDYVLNIPKGYSERLLKGEIDGLFTNYHVHDNYASTFMNNFLDEYTGTVYSYIVGGKDMDSAVSMAEETMDYEVKVEMEDFSKESESAVSEKIKYFFQFIPFIFISVMVVVLCPIISTLNNKEIRNRTNSSCVTQFSQTVQIFAGSAFYIIAVWIIFMAMGVIYNGGLYSGRLWYAVLNSLIFVVISAGIALLVAQFSPSDTAVNLITNVIGLGMSFLSGVFVPQSLLGDGIITASKFLPAYWYVRANDMICGSKAFSSKEMFMCMGMQMIFIFALFSLVILISKIKHDKGE